MKPPRFDYLDPPSVGQALDLLSEHGDEAKVLAGGQSLVPLMNLRLARPGYVIDLNGIAALGYIRPLNGGLAIGAMTRQRDVERSPLVRERAPLLAAAVPLIGHAAIRNRGTIGGSLAHADPAAELAAVAVALEASLVLASSRGERVVGADAFFVSYLTTVMERDEILLELRLPGGAPRTGSAFLEVNRRHGDFALVAVGLTVTLDGAGACTAVSGALAGVGAAPVPLGAAAKELLLGIRPDEGSLTELASRVTRDLHPESDLHASGEYRKDVARVLLQRALRLALQGAQGERR